MTWLREVRAEYVSKSRGQLAAAYPLCMKLVHQSGVAAVPAGFLGVGNENTEAAHAWQEMVCLLPVACRGGAVSFLCWAVGMQKESKSWWAKGLASRSMHEETTAIQRGTTIHASWATWESRGRAGQLSVTLGLMGR